MNGIETALQGSCGLAGQLYKWDFSVFDLHKLTGGRPLYNVTMALLQDQGLLDGWLLDRRVVEGYLTEVEGVYKANPYHNNTHAADVTQTAGVIMTALNQWLCTPIINCINNSSGNGGRSINNCGCFSPVSGSVQPCDNSPTPLVPAPANSAFVQNSGSNSSHGGGAAPASGPGLRKIERFAIILASAIHDLGHPGVNNAFLVRTRDQQAVIYNDKSVNEMMHASLAFQIAQDNPEIDIFARFSQEEYELVRKLVLDMVLSTDMDVHFALLKRYEDALKAEPDVRKWTSLDARSLVFQMLVHLADLANPSRPWPLALKWAEQVVTEFLSQGEKEAAAGIPISPPCDATKVCMPAAQLFFIERFMAPTLQAFRTSAPSFFDMASAWLADTQAKWVMFKSAGVRFPHQGYPQLAAPSAAEQGKLWTTLCGTSCCCGACVSTAPLQPQQQCKPQLEAPQHQAALQQPAQQPAAQAAG